VLVSPRAMDVLEGWSWFVEMCGIEQGGVGRGEGPGWLRTDVWIAICCRWRGIMHIINVDASPMLSVCSIGSTTTVRGATSA